MPIRLSGINSGLDTDTLVKELVSAYSLKKEKYQKEQTKVEWKQEAWKSLNTKIYGMYTSVSNLRYDSAYNMKKSSVSDITKAKVTASGSAVAGTQTLNVKQMAQAAYVTGAKLTAASEETEIKSTTKLSELGYTGADTEIEVNNTKIEIKKDMTINDVIGKMNEAGVRASFDEKNGRIFVSAKESGSAGEFNITASSATGTDVLMTLGLLTEAPADRYAVEKKIYDAAQLRKVDVATYISDTIASYKNLDVARLTALQEEHKVADEQYKAALKEYEEKQKENPNADLTEAEEKVRKAQEAFDAKQAAVNAVQEELAFMEEVKALGLAELAGGNKSEEELNAEIAVITDKVESIFEREYAVEIGAQDAEITLNGVKYTSSNNSFSINGLTIEVTGVTDTPTADGIGVVENPITITTSVDNQGIYDKVKDFLTEYNNVINEITKLYNADSAKDYQPLTDEEKDAMSDEQVEKWENKIKNALLRRDSSLGGVMNAMVNSMAQTVEVNGKKMSLADFGIKTLGFLNAPQNEHYAYHIDGDEDDENTSGKKDKLMVAIQEDPESVCEFMKQLTSNLYTAVDQKMKSTELSSAYKVYNDKELDSQLDKYKKMIKDWEEKVSKEEEYYYDKFSQMEVALSKLQNQSNSLAGLIGQY